MNPSIDQSRPFPMTSPAVDAICDDFESAWLAGRQPRIEDYLPRLPSAQQDELLRELLLAEWDLCHQQGQCVDMDAYRERFPEFCRAVGDLSRFWSENEWKSMVVDYDGAREKDTGELRDESERTIGRYRLLEKLGEGGFGTVWLAEQCEPVKRNVALKIIKLGPTPMVRWSSQPMSSAWGPRNLMGASRSGTSPPAGPSPRLTKTSSWPGVCPSVPWMTVSPPGAK